MTGTDTAAGKTVLTTLLVRYLRASGVRALAVKPFCSGGTDDLRALARVQDHELSIAQIAPWRFARPLAPMVAGGRGRRAIRLETVVAHVRTMASRGDCLLVEGCGGVRVPLAAGVFVVDLIAALRCPTVVVARNQLGVINHSLLTLEALKRRGVRRLALVLMGKEEGDSSCATNSGVLKRLARPAGVFCVGFLGRNPLSVSTMETNCRKCKKTLAQILDSVKLLPLRQRGLRVEKRS